MQDRPTLLCLNDNETALYMRKLALERNGFDVITTTQACDAMRVLQSRHVDVVIADHIMRDTTGDAIARDIKQGWPDIPIILFSADVNAPEDLGAADAFVSKAEGREALVAAVRRLLKADCNPHVA